MGGKALKSVDTIRISKDTFDTLTKRIVGMISDTFNYVTIPPNYRNKSDFGDIDVVIQLDDTSLNIRKYIEDKFAPREIFHNDNCYSFDYEGVQIDFIFTNKNGYESLCNYLGYSDLGNYIGRIANGFGLKFGSYGLWYEHKFKGSNIGSISISTDQRKILEFLGLSYEKWLSGFDDLEDIFKFIAESKYFNWKKFQLSELNKINRDRNLKRKSYMSFLQWVDENVADDKHTYIFDKSQDDYNDIIAEYFPEANLETEIRRLEYEYCKALYIKSKFNGGDVMRKYGFEGKQLGEVLSGFKKFIEEEICTGYEELILETQVSIIYELYFDMYLEKNNLIKNK